MYPFSHMIKETVPNYLSGLPIPDSIGGWFHLGIKDWFALIPPTAFVAGAAYVAYLAFCPAARKGQCCPINPSIKKDNPKVVDTVDVEDISEKAVFCRCWRTKNVNSLKSKCKKLVSYGLERQ